MALLDHDTGMITPIVCAGEQYLSENWAVTPDGSGNAPRCIKKALETGQICITEPADHCDDCAYADTSDVSATATFPINHQAQTVGVFHVHLSDDAAMDPSQKELLQEVGRDLGLARAKVIAENELTTMTSRFRKLFELNVDPIIVVDKDGVVRFANPAALEMFGLTRAEMEGQEFGFPAAGSGPVEIDTVKPGEGPRTAEMRSNSISWDGEKAFLVTLRDITDRKQTEEELKQTNCQLEETLEDLHRTEQQLIDQERQRALSQMASGIAHDFNNALSTILGFTDLLLESKGKLKDVDTARDYLAHVRKEATNAAETVRRMRKFYRPREDEQFKNLDLNSLIEEAISMTQPRWQEEARAEGISIDIEKDLGDLPELAGNESELHEMLTNLIFNAVDAMPNDGKIKFHTRQTDDEVLLEVGDTGEGMPEDVRLHCLEPFFTTKQQSGTGLGLSTVKGILKRHGGSISVESEEGEGTTFKILLPLQEPTKEQPEGSAPPQGEIGALKVLVVEDKKEQRELLAEYLSLDDHRVDVAPNGREGLRKFMQGYYDLVMTDRSMPEISGDRLAVQVKNKAPSKPVIMLTGFGDMMDAAEETPDGVDLVLSKPVSLDQLREALIKVMNENERQGR